MCVMFPSIKSTWSYLESSKMDQGATVVIACTGSRLCPVVMLERYLRGASVELGSSERFLFRGIVHNKNGMRLREKGGLSYTTVHETVLDKFQAIGLDKKQYGLHSLRAGELQLQLTLAYLTGFSNAMTAGVVRMQRMAM